MCYDGTTIVRRSNINNVEQLVDEPFYNNCGNNIVHISQKGKRKVSGQVKQISNKRSKLNDSAGNKLNFDDVEFLILEVEKRPPLWDYSLPLLQRKSTIKQRLWSEIALALNDSLRPSLERSLDVLVDEAGECVTTECSGWS
ncbi:uncharacterized protein LOC112458493 [Temnothorax curvispinosus]|uniref:Uncharacterized protein LOC112458493 n=1 Tax=Temnothorax curvispinosus TaxID=300111 RepID=A0A6J1Q6U3_9HYME|nr:uncharacterized protein LOC112458493 [Temnothorax curvispinosus]